MAGIEAWGDIPYVVLVGSNLERVLRQTLASSLVTESDISNTELRVAICVAFGLSDEDQKYLEDYLATITDVVSTLSRDHEHFEWEKLKTTLSSVFDPELYGIVEEVERDWTVNGYWELVFGMVQHVIKEMKYTFDRIIRLGSEKSWTHEIQVHSHKVRKVRNHVVHNQPHTFAGNEQNPAKFQENYDHSVEYCVNNKGCFPFRAKEELKRLLELKPTYENYKQMEKAYEEAVVENRGNKEAIRVLRKEQIALNKKVNNLVKDMFRVKALAESSEGATSMDQVAPVMTEIHQIASRHVDGATS